MGLRTFVYLFFHNARANSQVRFGERTASAPRSDWPPFAGFGNRLASVDCRGFAHEALRPKKKSCCFLATDAN
jgi:hypothetical protein